MNPLVMASLAGQLKERGYEVERFGYPLFPKKEDLGDRFIGVVASQKPDVIIGHSLGGNITVANIAKLSGSVRAIVCLGSPLKGSSIAKKISESKFPHLISAAAKELLVKELIIPSSKIRVGMISGTNDAVGFRLLFGGVTGLNDGTVSLEETIIPGLADRVDLRVGHTALLFSDEVVQQIEHFIVHRKFRHK